jgi:hypothetical protein
MPDLSIHDSIGASSSAGSTEVSRLARVDDREMEAVCDRTMEEVMYSSSSWGVTIVSEGKVDWLFSDQALDRRDRAAMGVSQGRGRQESQTRWLEATRLPFSME